VQITITVRGLAELQSRLANVQPAYNAAVRRFLTRSALLIQGEAQQRTPAAGFNTVKYSTGTLRRSITNQVDAAPFPRWAKVGTALPYGHFIEEGWRHDRRVKTGIVYRRLGPARMLATGLHIALPRIQQFGREMVRDIANALRIG
jgi:hypothetical protein